MVEETGVPRGKPTTFRKKETNFLTQGSMFCPIGIGTQTMRRTVIAKCILLNRSKQQWLSYRERLPTALCIKILILTKGYYKRWNHTILSISVKSNFSKNKKQKKIKLILASKLSLTSSHLDLPQCDANIGSESHCP